MTRRRPATRIVLYVPPDIARTWQSLRRRAGAPALLLDALRRIRAEASPAWTSVPRPKRARPPASSKTSRPPPGRPP
jgi:hypothetical protein